MPTTNARKHVIPLGAEASFSRATIFTTFGNSIRDVVPVATVTERTSVVNALTSAGQGPTSARPLVVYRHDAPGLHRLEWTVNGTTWLPSSGILDFASKAAADSWASSNPGMLSRGDEASIPNARLFWDGAKWVGGPPVGITYAGIYSASSVTPAQIRADRGYASWEGRIVSSSTTFDANTDFTIGTVPDGYRPAKEETFALAAKGASFARLTITPAGAIVFAVNVTFNGTLDMGVAPINYRIA
ncbi:hypothetical protein [Microbacterium enclense]|uniref:hypothetical protein n=1 Tax=Microbacterium enclense TaxID=993073 RepID=UPI0034444EA2